MNKLFVFLFVLTTSICHAQNSFEGIVHYAIEIETVKDSVALQKKLEMTFGKKSNTYYWKDGRFQINNYEGENIKSAEVYSPVTGKLTEHFFGDYSQKGKEVSVLRLRFLGKKKIANQTIMGKTCECFEYQTQDEAELSHTLTYCFSNETPKIEYRHFKSCRDFFLKEYYETSERPYLKYVLQNKSFKISYTATSLEIKPLDPSLYKGS